MFQGVKKSLHCQAGQRKNLLLCLIKNAYQKKKNTYIFKAAPHSLSYKPVS